MRLWRGRTKAGDGAAARRARALLAAALLCSTALAAPIAANFLDSAALIDEDGAVIVAPGAYDFIFALDDAGELFCGGSNEGGAYRYALLSGAGEPLSEQIYDMLALEDGVAQVLALKEQGMRLKDAAKEVAEHTGLSKNELYAAALER